MNSNVAKDRRDYDGVWNLLKDLVKENIKENEAITTGYSSEGNRNSVVVRYAGIVENVLYQGTFELDMGLMRVLPDSTFRQVFLDVLEVLRGEKCQ